MFTARRATAIALPAVLLFTLGGCALVDPSGDGEQLTGTAACALGHTWELNVDDLAEQIKNDLTNAGVTVDTVVASGSQTFDWSIEGHVAITSDYTITVKTVPAAEQVLTVEQTHSGSITGAAYINGEVAIPRKWDDSDFSVATTADLSGEKVEEADLTITIPPTDFDDSVGLELTCNGKELTIHPRGSVITQTWARKD